MPADIRQNVSRRPDYSDLDLDFAKLPTTGDVSKKTGAEAIKRAVRNLVLTNFYEHPFRSYIGSNVYKLLFEPINPLTATFIENAIKEVINNFEPRVTLIGIRMNQDIDNGRYLVQISFYINATMEPVITDLFLERIR
jgi:phage baseplate assembly protein W